MNLLRSIHRFLFPSPQNETKKRKSSEEFDDDETPDCKRHCQQDSHSPIEDTIEDSFTPPSKSVPSSPDLQLDQCLYCGKQFYDIVQHIAHHVLPQASINDIWEEITSHIKTSPLVEQHRLRITDFASPESTARFLDRTLRYNPALITSISDLLTTDMLVYIHGLCLKDTQELYRFDTLKTFLARMSLHSISGSEIFNRFSNELQQAIIECTTDFMKESKTKPENFPLRSTSDDISLELLEEELMESDQEEILEDTEQNNFTNVVVSF